MVSYSIVISEEQRKIIEAALHARFGNECPPDVEAEDAILFDMIRDLPLTELEHPGCLHGLCY